MINSNLPFRSLLLSAVAVTIASCHKESSVTTKPANHFANCVVNQISTGNNIITYTYDSLKDG
jgi:hypothetical protein